MEREKERMSLEGDSVILVPYMNEHVPKYHEWHRLGAPHPRPGIPDASHLDPRPQQGDFHCIKQLVVGEFRHGEPHVEATGKRPHESYEGVGEDEQSLAIKFNDEELGDEEEMTPKGVIEEEEAQKFDAPSNSI